MSFSIESALAQRSPRALPTPSMEEPRKGQGIALFMSPTLVFEQHAPITHANSLSPLGGSPGGMLVIGESYTLESRFVPLQDLDTVLGAPIKLDIHFQQLMDRVRELGAKQIELPAREPFRLERRETIIPEAEKHAKTIGVYGSLKLATETVHDIMPYVWGMTIDLVKDPEAEDDEPTICFHLTVKESVDRMLELDDALQRALFDRLPPKDRPHFSFLYDFE